MGWTSTPGDPFYSETVTGGGVFRFDIPVREEPALRAFLDEAAQRAGR